MEVIRAKIMGFCSGVRRAVSAAEKALSLNEKKEGTVWTLGPLIHNPMILEKLSERGLKILDEKEARVSEKDTVIIRAHGVSPAVMRHLRHSAGNLIDATCPLVMQSQKRASEYARRGYTIFFAGDEGHAEVVGIQGFVREAIEKSKSKSAFFIVKSAAEFSLIFDSLEDFFERKFVLLSQTTFSPVIFEEIRSLFKKKCPSAKVVCSICPATNERQESLKSLCETVDGVLVIGGRASANTNRLFATAKEKCAFAALIENETEIPKSFFSLKKVGVTAGASTPDDVIDSVENALKNGGL